RRQEGYPDRCGLHRCASPAPRRLAHRGEGVDEGQAVAVLELDDIQHILLTRTPAITGRYEFLSFDTPEGGRAWLTELLDKVQSAADVQATVDSSNRWVTLAFTWNGLRALGVPEESLATFPDEFRTGMAARADILGDTGTNAPAHWVGGLAGDDVHAIAILFSRTDEQYRRSIEEHDKL